MGLLKALDNLNAKMDVKNQQIREKTQVKLQREAAARQKAISQDPANKRF